MTSTAKILLLFLPLGMVLLIAAIYDSPNNSEHTDNAEKTAEPQMIPYRRTIRSATIHYCKSNQYYDQEEGRCLGVPGGGRMLHVENRQSCGINVLKPHCRSSLYYHICKRDKSILAQCASRQIFDNRLQRCVYYDSSKLTPNIILPDDYMYYNHIRMPSCTRSGRFPMPGHCSMFYMCDTNGQRFYQSVFKCPQNTGYQADRGVCNDVPDCTNDNSVDTTVCVPDAPGENVESPSLDEAIEGNVKEIPEILEESKAIVDDPIVEKEENVNSKIYDDIITTTPVTIIDTLSENNYNDNDSDTDVLSNNASSSKPVKEDLVSDGIDEKIIHSQASNPPEIVQKAFEGNEGRNEEDGSSLLLGLRITSPSPELDDASDSITNSMTSIKPEYRTNADIDSETTDTVPFSSDSYILSKLNEGTQDVTTERYKNIEDSAVTLSNVNTEAIDSLPASTINNVPEIPPINDVPSKINEETQDVITEQYRNNEDSVVTPSNFNTDSVDSYSTPTVSSARELSPISDVLPKIDEEMQDATTEQYKNNEDSIVMPSNFDTDSTDLYSASTVSSAQESSPISDISSTINEKMQDVTTDQYKNNEDSLVTPSNFNIDSADLYSAPTISSIRESSPISDVSPNIDEKMQETTTEQYKNNEDSVVTSSNFDTDSTDPYSAPTVSSAQESSPISDISPTINEKMQDATTEQYKNNEDSLVTPSNFDIDSADLYSAPTISSIQESSPISDVSSNLDEKMQDADTEQFKNNEDSVVTPSNFDTDSTDPYSAPTVSSAQESSPISDISPTIDEKMQDATTEQYKNNEDSLVTPSNFDIDSADLYSAPTISSIQESSPISDVSSNLDEKMQDADTEQFKNNEDSVVTPSNFDTDSTDLYSAPTVNSAQESSPISDISSTINEKMQDATTEQYKNNEDSVVTPSNFDTDSTDLYSAPTVNSAQESSPISDISSTINEKMQDATTEQYKNNEDSVVTPSNFDTDSTDLYSAPTVNSAQESSPISDISSTINEKMQDATTEQYKNNEDSLVMPSNFDIDSADLYSAPTISSIQESSPISDVSPNIDEKMQETTTEQYKNNEDSVMTPSNFDTDSTDLYSAPTVSSAQESSPISDISPTINEKMQDVTTEQYKNNEDDIVTPSNFDIDSTDLYSAPAISSVRESSTISDVSSKLNEEIENVTTAMYRNHDKAVTLPNFSTEVVDPNLTSVLHDISATTNSPRNDDSDVLSSSSTPTILPSQTVVDQLATEGLSEAIPSIEVSKLADASLFTSDGIESASARYLPENTDDLYLTPTTGSTLIPKEVTTPMDIATTIPSMQDPPISETDLVTQNGKDSTEASASFTE